MHPGDDLGPELPDATPRSTGNTPATPAWHLGSMSQGDAAGLPEQEVPKAATIPFGRSGSQVSLGHSSRGCAWKAEEEADDGLGFFEDESGHEPGTITCPIPCPTFSIAICSI